jgi:hypothetical protein
MSPINNCNTDYNFQIDQYMTISNIQGQIFYNMDLLPILYVNIDAIINQKRFC